MPDAVATATQAQYAVLESYLQANAMGFSLSRTRVGLNRALIWSPRYNLRLLEGVSVPWAEVPDLELLHHLPLVVDMKDAADAILAKLNITPITPPAPEVIAASGDPHIWIGAAFCEEEPQGDLNGVNTRFLLTYTPLDNSLSLIYNGEKMDPIPGEDGSKDYSLSGKTVMMSFPPQAGDRLRAQYLWSPPA